MIFMTCNLTCFVFSDVLGLLGLKEVALQNEITLLRLCLLRLLRKKKKLKKESSYPIHYLTQSQFEQA